MELPGLETRQLTDHPHVDYYPRISPDGRKVVFARSQVPNLSQRDKVAWDVYVLELSSGQEALVATNANAPTWSSDGRKVFFQRNADTFVEHDLVAGEERILFKSGQGNVPSGIVLSYPNFNEQEEKLAVTVRGAARMTAIIGVDGSRYRVGGGCTLSWAPGNEYLYLIGHGGKQINRFYKFNRQTKESTEWLDLPGDRSHEYFPRVSNDGNYLVFGASKGDHELGIADYEIFLWEIGAPAEEAIRLTYSPANDCWPDIHVQRVSRVGMEL